MEHTTTLTQHVNARPEKDWAVTALSKDLAEIAAKAESL